MTGDSHKSLIGVFAGALCCKSAFECNLAFDTYGGILLWICVMLYMFKALGVICDEYFVPSLEVIVDKLQLSNDVAGATFMAAGSSAPELFTSLVATFLIVNEGGVGTIIGSAIFNILVIVGATGFIACKDQSLKIWWYPLCRDCFFYCLAICELMIILSNESVEWYEGVIMICTYCLYCIYMKFNPKIIVLLGITDPSENEVSIVDENDAAEAGLPTPMPVKDAEQVEAVPMGASTMNGNTESALRSLGAGENLEEKAAKPPELAEPGKTELEITSIHASEMAAPGAVAEVAVAEDAMKTIPSQTSMKQTVSLDVKETGAIQSPIKETACLDKTGADLEYDSTATLHSIGTAGSGSKRLAAPEEHTKDKRRPSWGFAETNRAESKERQRRNSKDRESIDSTGSGGREGSAAISEGESYKPEPLAVLNRSWKSYLRDPMIVCWELSMPDPDRMGGGALFSASIAFIGICTYIMVDATNRVGVILHIPPLAMAVVFLAAGTSIPDALGSIAVAKQGEGDMAVSNALGSNVFDILLGLGIPWTIKTGFMGEKVVFPGKWDELIYDIFVLIAVLLIFVGCLAVHKWYLTRRVGILLLCGYVVFIIYNICAVWVFDPALKAQAPEAYCDVL